MTKIEDKTSVTTNVFDQDYIELPDLEGFIKDEECECKCECECNKKKRMIFVKRWDGNYQWVEPPEPGWGDN